MRGAKLPARRWPVLLCIQSTLSPLGAVIVKRDEGEAHTGFKKIASESLGLRSDDETQLVPLSIILDRLEELYSRDITLFESTAERLEREERSFQEITEGISAFWARLKQLAAIPESKALVFQCVPLESLIFDTKGRSEAHHQFLARYSEHYRFNDRRGKGIFEFMLAHYMQHAPQFATFNRGLRSRILDYSSCMESIYSIWESNQFGRLWTLPGSDLPRKAYASANYRLVDAFFLSIFQNGV